MVSMPQVDEGGLVGDCRPVPGSLESSPDGTVTRDHDDLGLGRPPAAVGFTLPNAAGGRGDAHVAAPGIEA
jgi:hypothetical protein